jgi:hypothetical protein
MIAIFSSPLLSCIEGLFPFPYADLSTPFLINPEPKLYIFPHICYLTALQDAYTLDAPLHLAYIGICAIKYKMGSGFPCHDRISLIFGLPYTRNSSDSALQLHSGGYKSIISSYGKRGKRIQL